ncbi:GNAT family N-acetyltransferase [Vibrio sp. Of14-4]|uniref:GNAT family N-acetyltransferase n=1 Tax=Vibrio sp. Of14-4 TaxID=2724878 RepID=UPI001EF35930|nr:GNAT family N-acetyltransferase [Vibrio sp. Of14-4]MCG7491732.1 GNAT family N-acetyltransferase [Vibrio sp. Of14-4]
MQIELPNIRIQNSIFTTSNLMFKPVCASDGKELFDAFSANAFHPDLALSKLDTLNKARQWCGDRSRDWKTSQCFVWTCRHQVDLSLVGQVTLLPRLKDVALAYWVAPEKRGRGYATTMCREVLRYIIDIGYEGNVWAGVHTWNKGSMAVLSKLGFKQIELQNDFIKEFHLPIESL